MSITTKKRKYFVPQREDKEYVCDFPNCHKLGEYRAPKDRSLKEYYWFCLDHVKLYNAGWNYYDGDEADDSEADNQTRAHFHNYSSKVHYQFGYRFKDDFDFMERYGRHFSSQNGEYYTQKELEALQIMDLPRDKISVVVLKKQYKKLVKKYHPDLHRGDANSEEKFKQLTIAYKILLEKLS